jgi:hypothetical protein
VTANVVEAVDVVLTVLGKNELETRYIVTEEVTRLGETKLVCDEEPSLGEDGTTFKLVHIGRGVP